MPVFIVGVPRSGTNMLLDVLEQSPGTLIYNENNRRAFKNYRIRGDERRLLLLRNSRCPVVVFKPLNDTHEIDRLIEKHPNCKVIWVYRRYEDVVNSNFRKWKDWSLVVYRSAMNHDKWDESDIVRKNSEVQQMVSEHYSENMDALSAWALTWYLKNEIFFQYGLDRDHERVLLVKYDNIVKKPHDQFSEIFNFLGLDFDPSYTSQVHACSVRKNISPKINPQIRVLCDKITQRLDDLWQGHGA